MASPLTSKSTYPAGHPSTQTGRQICLQRCPKRPNDYNVSFGAPKAFIEDTRGLIHANYAAVAWQMFRRLSTENTWGYAPGQAEDVFFDLFKKNQVRNILDVGCGPGAYFLTMLQPLCQTSGIKLYGIDNGQIYDHTFIKEAVSAGIELAEGDAEDIGKHFPGISFDIIVSSGVLGQAQFMIRHKEKYDPMAFLGTRRDVWDAVEHATAIISSAVSSLSTHDTAAVYIQCFSSFFLLQKAELETKGIRVLYWNSEEMHSRPETKFHGNSNLYNIESYMPSGGYYELTHRRECAFIRTIWENGANVSVLSK